MCRLGTSSSFWTYRRAFSVPFLLCFAFSVNAQETPATQQYAQRLFVNPAFAGLLSEYSATAGHRSQWTGTENGFSTQWLSGEYRFEESKTAVGVTVLSDRSAAGGFSRVQAGAMYAYHTKLKPKLDFSAGLQAAYASQRAGFSNLIFEDQLDPDGTVQQPSAENNRFSRTSYLTVSTGLLLYTNQFWLGVSAQHLNNPAIGNSLHSNLPPLLQVQTGYRFYAKSYFARNHFEEISFIPTFSFAQQRNFKRLDFVFYSVITPVTLGVGYTTLPGTSATSSASAFTALAGITYKSFKFGYSYRQPLGQTHVALGPGHEVSLSFQLVDYRKIYKKLGSSKNYNRIACPEF